MQLPPTEPTNTSQSGSSLTLPVIPEAKVIPHVAAAPNSDVNQTGVGRALPTVHGKHLQLGPQELAAERAVLLSQLLDQAQAEARVLRDRVASLELQLASTQRNRLDMAPELELATEELRQARRQLEALHAEVASLQERMRRLDKQELDTLREVVTFLEQLGREHPTALPRR